jgi:hypothetical protein
MRVKVIASVAVVAAAAGLILWLRASDTPSGASLDQLVQQVGQDDRPELVARAIAEAGKGWPAHLPDVLGMLQHDNARLRVLACRILGATDDRRLVPLVVARASDSDWRVRTAAFEALRRWCPTGLAEIPAKDVPLGEREPALLAWMEAYGRQSGQEMPREICEIYANVAHVEFGQPMVARCLNCHAGDRPGPFEDSARCEVCHGGIYDQWSRSAHANSLTHLHLVTVDSQTRTTRTVDFGAVRGIACTQCHRVVSGPSTTASAATTTASAPARCPYTFDRSRPPSGSCKVCHAVTWTQWQQWREIPHRRPATWPPGQHQLVQRDDRTGSDCHMPTTGIEPTGGARVHSWAARRDVQRLRDGLDLRVSPPDRDGRPRIQLTNLAGHAYPAESRRRALRLWVTAGGHGAEQAVATLQPDRPGQVYFEFQPALAPAEDRMLLLPAASGAGPMRYGLRYYRNLADPQAYTADVQEGDSSPPN